MLDQETIAQQLDLLTAHRRTLATLLQQQALLGIAYTPPAVSYGITEARAEVARIKEALREGGVAVEDKPNDEASSYGHVIDQQIFQPSFTPTLHQLRAPVTDFVGREQEVDQLVQALTKASSAAAAISGVRGMGGIGKTELAHVVAQRLKDAFPDAQLLVELQGATNSPITSEQALQTVIRAFERKAKLPDDVSQLKGMYNSVLTGRRVLILADDAKDAGQIRPLLPPQGSALLITSRNRFSLPGMIALDLGILSPEEAVKLLREICPRIRGDAAELAKLCGYLPLALRISAGVLETNDSRSVPRFLEQLRVERLKHLADPDDPAADVEASLQLSYTTLDVAVQASLVQLSVFVTSFDPRAAQAVVEIEEDITGMLEILRRRSLLEWDAKLGRYSLHDLVRAFAA
jgi:hypothetical protein